MKLELDEFTVAYEDSGRGPPLLLLHGFPLGRRVWRPQLEGLLSSARVIAPDLRGHGDSEATTPPFTIEQLATDCIDLLDELEIDEPVVACGLSMGGYVALALAKHFPERVAGLVLTSTRAGADSKEAQAGRDKSIALVRRDGVPALVEAMLPKLMARGDLTAKPGVVSYVKKLMLMTSSDGAIGALEAMKHRPDMTSWLARYDKPVLIVHGAEDVLIAPSEALAMQAALPGARLELIAHAGHLPNMEAPTAFNTAVRAFLRFVYETDGAPH